MAITVEGKVRESFNDPVRKWINIITSPSGKSGKPRRLDYLIKKLDIQDRDVSEIRYQLLHRTVSALIMAEQFNAPLAMMLVHSFSQEDEHIKDYQEFAGLFNVKADVNTITFAGNKGGVDLYLAWVRGEERFLRV